LYSGRLSPADKVALSYLTIVAGLILASYNRIDFWWLLLPAHFVAMAIIFIMARWLGRTGPDLVETNTGNPQPPTFNLQPATPNVQPATTWLAVARSWYPLILIPLTYKELGYVIHLIHPHDFDRELALIDHRILGVDPVIWLDRLNYPIVTLIMQASYLTYYLSPVVLALVLWRGKRFGDYQFFLFVILLGLYVSYLGYIAVPAIGPRFFLSPGQVKPFGGPGVAAIRATLDRMEGITRDCFPSGHTELTLLVLFCAHRFHRKLFYILLPIGMALILSTVYLRYHYVIDVVAGAGIAAAVAMTSDRLYRAAGGATDILIDSREAGREDRR
jgi:membrane-associated phospholipid phosphatase